MKAYSLDFRQKIIQAYEEEKLSIAKLERRFKVAKSFIQKLIKQWRETGDLNPKKSLGGKRLKLSPAQIILVGDWVEEKTI